MGNANTCRTLGIAPQAQIGSQDFKLLWDSYDKGQGYLTEKQARKFLRDFAEAVKMDSHRFELVADFVLRDLLNAWGRLDEEKFQELFMETVKDSSVQLTSSLLQKLDTEEEVIDQEAMWREEEAKTIEERRRRYKCKANFTTAEAIQPWATYSNAAKLQAELIDFLREEMELDEQDRQKERLKKMQIEQEEREREERRKQLEQQKKAISESESEELKKTREKLAKKAEQKKKKQLENEEKRRARRKQLEELLNIKPEDKKPKKTKVVGAAFLHEVPEEKEMEDKGKEAEESSELKNGLNELPKTPFYDVNPEFNKRVAVWKGDITSLELDAIVNAANKSCLGGGGVDGAIHSAAGRMLYLECTTLNGCPTGKAKITKGYNLPAKHIIHTVGPILNYSDFLTREKEAELEQCYWNSLNLAAERGVKSIAFCGISTGIYGYPPRQATRTALNTVRTWLEKDDNYQKIDLIVFCQYLPKELAVYEGYMPLYFPVTEFKKSESSTSTSTTSTTSTTTPSASANVQTIESKLPEVELQREERGEV
eukprot:TRINITY_DN5591_c0_g1_i2.p1 TRINITY_DN5591_c0_g1~~TRINITY_DN5591_c0_g1_i2.p1  ORF type:complete len:541 (+),score=160.63 TRINITY_DN5591_c0_g1_i2:152-1774(+)